jgi:hypothetical protein
VCHGGPVLLFGRKEVVLVVGCVAEVDLHQRTSPLKSTFEWSRSSVTPEAVSVPRSVVSSSEYEFERHGLGGQSLSQAWRCD